MQIKRMKGLESIGAIGKGKISNFHPLRSFYVVDVSFFVLLVYFCL